MKKKITQKIKTVFVVAIMVLVTMASFIIEGDSSNPDKELVVKWEKNFTADSDEFDEGGNYVDIVHNQSGYVTGFIVAGFKNQSEGNNDIYLIKTDKNGNQIWNKTIGGGIAKCIQQTDDDGDGMQNDGYVIVGSTVNGELYVIKTDENGTETWNKTYSTPLSESSIGYFIQQTYDHVNDTYDGYIITGNINYYENEDLWVIKTDENGSEGPQYEGTWNYTYDSPYHQADCGFSVNETANGSYIVTGTLLNGPGSGSGYCCLFEFNAYGNLTHEWFYGSNYFQNVGTTVKQAPDGDYVITGFTGSYGDMKIWLIKQNPIDNSTSITTYSDGVFGQFYSLDVCTGGGYIISGRDPYLYLYVIKTYENGTEELSMKYKGDSGNYAYASSIQEISFGKYIVTGQFQFYNGDFDIFLIEIIEDHKPNSPSIEGPNSGLSGVQYKFNFSSIDPDNDNVGFYVDWGDNTNTGWTENVSSGTKLELSHTWTEGGSYNITAKARDIYGAESDWSVHHMTIVENHPPNPPLINGPPTGKTGESYNYTFNATDPDGDDVFYKINWSDGNITEWLGPNASGEEILKSHAWAEPGGYNITAKTKDSYDAESNWSNPFNVTIEVNYPPNDPTITGPIIGKAGQTYNYAFVTTDPNEDNVSYYIDWEDGTNSDWIGPYDSGESVICNHTWEKQGNFTIKAKARDTYYYESDWGTLEVKMPFNIFGNTISGSFSQNIKNKITGSIFNVLANCTADNISVYVQTNPSTSPETECMIYRVSGSVLIGTTEEKILNTGDEGAWVTFNFSEKPNLVTDTEYVLVCWSNDTCNFFYDNSISEQSRYRNETYSADLPVSPIDWTSNESKIYSIFCRYTTKPDITNVSATPNTVGFGFNVTISAYINDNGCDIDNVSVNITYPNNITGNFTMNNTGDGTYAYVFNDTWFVGQYNYTIWAVDESGGTNNSSVHNFNVSAQTTIGIATLKDVYSDNEYINITDPPTPPSDYYLVDRGLTWDKYYNANTGKNILEISAGPINYQDENSEWNPIECNLSMLSSSHPAYQYGYRAGNEHGLYNVYFKPNAQNSWPVAFAYNKSDDPNIHVIKSKLVGVGYLDPQSDWAYKFLQNVQSSQGQISGNSAVYEDVFTGTDVTWRYCNTQLKEEITLSNTTKTLLQNHPPSEYGLNNESSYLVFITKLDHQSLDMYNSSGILNGNVTVSGERIDFKDALGYFRCALPIGDAYEQNNESARQKLTYRIIQYNGNTYLLSGLKLSDLNEMTFPVIIDPTLTIDSLSSDGYIYNSNTNYNTAWGASTGMVSSSATYISIGQKKTGVPSTYYVYRGFLLFDTSSIPSNVVIDNATLSLYKYEDYSTTDFTITIQDGQPVYPHNPLQVGDYSRVYYQGNGGGLNTANFVNGRNNITLTNLSWITKGGTTKLCLRSSRDISGTAPTGDEHVNVCSYEYALPAHAPRLVIEYRNQSKINNTGSTNISGYLLIQVQYYNASSKEWVVDNDTVNESSPRIVYGTSGPVGQNVLALDTIFNDLVKTSDLTHGNGLYRVYTAFRDPNGNVLVTDDETELEAWYEFNVNI
jgi:hypothetical protein